MEASRVDLDRAREVARRGGAGTLVMGQVSTTADSLLVTARLYDVRSGAPLNTVNRAAAVATDPRPLFEELARYLLDVAGGTNGTTAQTGKCGGLKKKTDLGDLIWPIAAIRGEGTSNDYYPAEVPALPSFALQKAISTTIRDYNQDYWTGTVFTTNRRVWEWDEEFKAYLRKIRAAAIDMETATIFTTAFYNKIPTGALLLVSDSPMVPDGVKTEASDKVVTKNYVELHLKIGIDSLKQLINNGMTVKHLRY
jgi:predicted AMP nucleosidase